MVKNNNINYTFKLLYALGIILVVAGHCNGGGFSIFYEYFPIYAFHLGLFVFASGYFYNPENENNIIKSEDDCAVFIDDINIKKYNIKSLHSQIGYVPQEPSLFDGTIRENVIYGLFDDENMILNNKDPYEKELKWSLHTAQADFVYDENTFPLGLNTIVGSKGAKLSGGQKQRIAIARALIKKPKILILDEATSALDSESESKFQLELDNLKGKMTIIVVSHRLCTIKDCDQIVVINKGQIVEKGNHDELIAIKGIYYSLMEKQLEKE